MTPARKFARAKSLSLMIFPFLLNIEKRYNGIVSIIPGIDMMMYMANMPYISTNASLLTRSHLNQPHRENLSTAPSTWAPM